jgi:DNA polymerase (family 10)
VPPLGNRDIAALFFEMAELLHIQGGDPYRIRAFNRTGRILENMGEPVTSLIDRGTLEKQPGIGEGSAYRIKQMLRTGTCDDLKRLEASLPSGLRDMLDLKGVGARTVRILWSHLRIGTIDELEVAARTGKLAALPRFGERSEERILEAIGAWRQRASRLPLYKALRIGGSIVQEIRKVPDVVRVELTGSARRGKSTVGDLDVLVAADDGAAAVARFVSLPGVAEVLWRGDGRCSVRLESRQQVDMRVIPPENFGAGLHYFTGSQLHNIAIRARGNRFQLRLSEHGVFRREDDVRLAPGEEEAHIFAAVGLPWIPPELRENTGEIEAAAAGRLPTLIEERDLLGDLHMHTVASDGKGTAREMAEAAIALGHSYIAITDHSKSLEIANGLDERRLLAQGDELRTLEDRIGRIRLLRGMEVDILPDGSLDIDPQVLRQLDWVVGSVHNEFDMPADRMTERMVRAIESGLIDCVGHPTGRQLGIRDGYAFDVPRIMQACLRTGVALEVNGSPKRMDIDDVTCRHARELGVIVAINTDAHAPDHLPYRAYGLACARRGWLEKKDVLNAWPAQTLAERRKDRMRRSGVAVSVFVDPEPPPAVAALPDEVDALASALADPSALDAEMLARVERFLTAGDDAALQDALTRLGGNPVQKAFEIVLLARASLGPA